MVAPQTENRKRKKDFLYKSMSIIIDLIGAKEIEKDRINMAHFKKLLSLVEEMSNMAFCLKRASEISTDNSENEHIIDIPRQDTHEVDEIHEK